MRGRILLDSQTAHSVLLSLCAPVVDLPFHQPKTHSRPQVCASGGSALPPTKDTLSTTGVDQWWICPSTNQRHALDHRCAPVADLPFHQPKTHSRPQVWTSGGSALPPTKDTLSTTGVHQWRICPSTNQRHTLDHRCGPVVDLPFPQPKTRSRPQVCASFSGEKTSSQSITAGGIIENLCIHTRTNARHFWRVKRAVRMFHVCFMCI